MLMILIIQVIGVKLYAVKAEPHRILLDTDVDTDDFFALLYLLKLNRSEFRLEAITISTNRWTDAGHAVNQIYDLLYMMGRDDIAVGVGGEGGIMEDGNIQPNVGGYLPIIEQASILVGLGGRLYIDTNYGIRKAFLPQGSRKYTPLRQPTAQQVLIETISKGPVNVFITGVHTNVAIFLMSNPHLKKNVEHIYVMGGGVRSENPTGCCHGKENSSSCKTRQCGDCAYQVLHSGIPVTLIPLDATNTIQISEEFFKAFEANRGTYEAEYCFQSLKMSRDTWFDDQFYTSYFMWDSFMSGVAVSIMRNLHTNNGENEFAEMEYMDITVVTSNKPYGISNGSNPFFDGLKVPKFKLMKGGVHSGHVQTGLRDPLCFVENGKGKCEDGYTKKVTGPDAVRVLVATKAKANKDIGSKLNREFYISFLDALNSPEHTGRFNRMTEFPHYREVLFKPDFRNKKLGKPVVFDMDMSSGDFVALFYLLKVPVEVLNLKVIGFGFITNAATIDIVYDVLHMMGRDNIPVGLGDVFAMNQSDDVFHPVGECKYAKAIPHGSGGFLDSDTLYGLARELPRSPRRYTAENSVKFGAPRDTDHPELRQPLALEIWNSILKTLDPGSKITVLTNGPLTSLAKIITQTRTASLIENVYIVGGHISRSQLDIGNVFSIPSNKYAEFNMFLDPFAAKTVFESGLNITLIPLDSQRKVGRFPEILERLQLTRKTPEVQFVNRLLFRLHTLQQTHHRYHHMGSFLGEILGAIFMPESHHNLKPTTEEMAIKVVAEGVESMDGRILIDENSEDIEKCRSYGLLRYICQ
ncbi:receptor-like cytosolic serine/threonine-protein kinase RBK2-like [Hibiscus syriacus]|uniref:Receptor-like cytosolic serine/threonine-protein kinase RBK2-like n=1 Tax=Hibiscus syriacus TaxID=106335 RepID=A0A6A2X9G4_HIBSY|nr:receptor-like cytosolic serine/threonine-protein kinase RBK2-like [Hibiscus syriacus]